MLNRATSRWRGYRTRFVAHCVSIGGGLVVLYDVAVPYVAPVDWTPVSSHLPQWAWPIIVVGLGVLFAYLRRITTTPVGIPAGTVIVATPETVAPVVLPPILPVT